MNQYGRVSRKILTDECLNQYKPVSKEDTDEYKKKDYTDECLNQYGRVSKEHIDEYQRKV